jgi:hypothetical protein
MHHQYIKAKPSECIVCGEEKGKPMIGEIDLKPCLHDCDARVLQGDGRWIWCSKCKQYLVQP